VGRVIAHPVYLVNLGIAFLVELCLPVIFAYTGIHLTSHFFWKVFSAISIPVLVVLIWWKYYAPSSSTRLKEPALLWAKIAIFSLAVVALFIIGLPVLAAIYGIVTASNMILLYSYGSDDK